VLVQWALCLTELQESKLSQTYHGLFVGLVALDLVYLATSAPSNNQKVVASDYTVAAGGPATNAAVTFSHPMTQLIQADLETYGVATLDLNPSQYEPPPVSSIIVTQATGERAVISINAVKSKAAKDSIPDNILQGIDIVLIDGHQMEVGVAIAKLAIGLNIPVVIDGGSWKSGFESVLPFVDYAICSANFYPPNCNSTIDVFAYLSASGISHIAITQGEKPIQYLSQDTVSNLEVPQIKAVDTLGGGDVFHGAFCYYILRENFTDALAAAADIASYSCQFFGTRHWMHSER